MIACEVVAADSCCYWLGGVTLVAASPPAALRWQATDGRSFEGVFLGSEPTAKAKAAFAGPAGVRLAVDPAQLTAADRERLDDLTRSGAAARAAALAAPFRAAPSPDRAKVPLLKQGEVGKLTNNCLPNTLAAFLLWWDQQGVLGVPHQGDPSIKAAWLHERLTDYCATSETAGTSTRNARRGLRSYFERHLAGTAALRVETDFDCTPANLARYPVGLAACLLNITVYHGDIKQGGHFVTLLNATPDGTLRFRTWGLDFQGKLRVLPPSPANPVARLGKEPAVCREIDLGNTAQLPKWFRQLRIRFVLDPAEWNGITVAVPSLYQKQPGTAPAPPDPLFEGLPQVFHLPAR